MALLYNLLKGSEDPNVGCDDIRETVDSLTRQLNKDYWLEDKIVESVLFSCNLMNENGKFWHPRGITFDQFTQRILRKREKYNKKYGTIDEKE